jgi:hypothetical protein
MARDASQENLRALALTYGSVAIWAIASIAAVKIIKHHPENAGVRAAGIGVGVAGFLMWQVAVVRLVRRFDEFTRRLYLIAFSIAFAVTGLFIITCDLLQRAGFIDYVSLMTIWLVMLGTWAVALAAAQWYYCR